KPADSEKTLPALSIPAIRVSAARMSLKRVNALEDALWRHPGPIRKHGPTTSPGSTAYASARRHRKTMLRLRHGLGLLSRISPQRVEDARNRAYGSSGLVATSLIRATCFAQDR